MVSQNARQDRAHEPSPRAALNIPLRKIWQLGEQREGPLEPSLVGISRWALSEFLVRLLSNWPEPGAGREREGNPTHTKLPLFGLKWTHNEASIPGNVKSHSRQDFPGMRLMELHGKAKEPLLKSFQWSSKCLNMACQTMGKNNRSARTNLSCEQLGEMRRHGGAQDPVVILYSVVERYAGLP